MIQSLSGFVEAVKVCLNHVCSSECQGGMENTQQGGRKNYQGSVQWCEGAGAMLVVHISSKPSALSSLTPAQGNQGRRAIGTKLLSLFL